METISVCKDCQERKPACLGSCEKYLAARKEMEAKKAAKLYEYHMDCAMNAVQYNALRKYRKNKKGN